MAEKIKGRVYISGKISGMDEMQSKAKFRKAENELWFKHRVHPCMTFNPWVLDYILKDAEYEEFMRVDLAVLSICDAIYMLNNWEDSAGAKRELAEAQRLGLDIYYEPEEEVIAKRRKK